MSTVAGKMTIEVTTKFLFEEILEFVGATSLTPVQFEEIANILVANLESPTDHNHCTVTIEESNFNDCFYDMQEELVERYGDK